MSTSNSSSYSISPPNVDPSTPVQEIPVLIVGAGPVGLFEAVLLTKIGIRVRIIEREPQIAPMSRALGTQARSLEILSMVEEGFIDKILAQGRRLQIVNLYYGSRPMCAMPYARHGGTTRFEKPLFMEQEKLSKVLAKELEEMGVKIEFGWELVDTEVVESVGNESYVKTMIRQTVKPENGEREHQVIRSEFLVAADGGRSTVRHKVNIPFPGKTLSNKNIMFDGIIDTDLELKDIIALTGVNYKTMFIMRMSDSNHRIVVEVDDFGPDDDLDQINRDLTVADLERYVKACLHPETKFKVIENHWLICYRVNERRAENYIHKDRILLAGDAAHVHSPAGGQGMNTGLQDSYNLAWKLALVINKLAPISLLQTYHDERLPMAERAIALSSKLLDRARDQGPVFHYIKRFFLTVSPLLMFMKSLFFPRENAMLGIRYPANSINQPHKTQPQPKDSAHQVGARAPDGPIIRLTPVSSEDVSTIDRIDTSTEGQQVHVQEILLGVGKFHVLVFAGDSLADPTSFQEREKELANRAEEHLSQWRSRWHYTISRDNKTDNQLFKFNVIGAGKLHKVHLSGSLVQRAQGNGRLFWDSAEFHGLYGVPQAKGAIVVIRPDSQIAYRVEGHGKEAWADVTEYFESILT
ncbi:MAG: FAD binding domain-containing protein [Podila humilis]|nr:MAG: FAD binding domain-containing protein [Podila humilis]